MPRTPVCPIRKRAVVSILAFIFTLILLAGAAPAQTRNRIMQRIADTEPVVVSLPNPRTRTAFDQGRVEGSLNISHAAIVFKLAPAQQADLEKLLAEQQDPQSANYRRWLTPEQYAARFGMSDGDLAQVTSWLKSQGLTVDGFSRARTRVFFSGSAAQVEDVFHTELHRYLLNGQISLANATEISVPQAISGMVLGVRGLDTFRPLPRARVARPNFTSHVSGSHFVSPGDFATIYNLKPLYDNGLDGTGEAIAVVGQTQIHTADIDAFRTAAGLSPKNLQLVAVNGTGFSSGDEVEADLDVEWSGAVAKNAAIFYVYTGSASSQNVFNALEYAIDHNVAPVITTSYGNCEANLGAFTATLRADVQQANSQGQTVMAASGDAGAADCETQSAQVAIHGLAVDSPGSVPEVTAIGGSEFTGDATSSVSGGNAAADPPYWGATTGGNDNVSSALIYIPEMGWNDTAASIAASGGLSASGGGVSTVFAKPSWQTALTFADGHRDVPDVSLNASPAHDGSLICSQAAVKSNGSNATSCSAGFRDSAGNLSPVGGTSVGAPAFAGIVAILNQATQSGGLGNINPTLYSLGGTGAFHDITTGNNIVPCTSGTPVSGSASIRCPTSAPFQLGYSAAAGYDLVTGLGSINANVLATSWPGFVLTPNFSVGGTPVSVASAGQGGTSTVTVTPTNGFVATVDLACALTPASTTAGVTCSIPASVSLNGSSQAASLTISTTAPHVLSGTASSQGPHGMGWLASGSTALFAGIFFLGVPSRRRRMTGFGLMLLVFFAAGVGCGGGSSSGGSVKTGGTPKGSYSITVTATSGSLTHTANVAVTVQ